MLKVLIVYYSRSGRTKEMALFLRDQLIKGGAECVAKPVSEVKVEELRDFDGIVIGSPTYYGTMSAEIKQLLDESVKLHGKLDGKVGGAFTSSANLAGGNETTT